MEPPAVLSPEPTPERLKRSLAASVLGLRCPVCREGKVFENFFLKMNPTCPACGLKFEREPGYFLGAMYFSYAMAIPPLTLMTIFQKWMSPGRTMISCILVSALIFVPLVVPIVRYSRVMWLHFDRFFDPHEKS